MKRVPSLDGLRAISICLVLLSHVFLHAHPQNEMQGALLAIIGDGETGVSVFFVISGFLITLLLLKEKQVNGRISLAGFYVRRIFRILPAFILYIAVVAVIAKIGTIEVPHWQFLRALTFTMDYVTTKNWYIGHTWSLSVEEQFYLVWPLLAVLCSRRALTWIAASVIVLEPFIRMADRVLLPSTRYEIIYMFHTRADMLMFGCLVALLFENQQFIQASEIMFRKNGPAVAAIFLLIASPLLEWKFKGLYLHTIGYSLQGTSIALLMLFAIRRADTSLGRLLNAPMVVWVGVLSYSLYLWQELFIGFDTFSTERSLAGLILVVPVAAASYYLVEKPMLKVKSRFEEKRKPVKILIGTNSAPSQIS
jgi:peptidoglycan/LPS O-acetylase OafA/YrhL